MFYKNSVNEILNDIQIPSVFFDIYLPIATGDQLKVYFLGFREASYNVKRDFKLTNNVIANMLGLSLTEVENCWKFWESMELIKIHNSNNEYSIEFIDIKYKHLMEDIDSIKDSYNNTLDVSSNISSSVQISQEEDTRLMYDMIEEISGRILTPNEKMAILETIDTYNMDKSLVIEAFEKSVQEHGKIKSVNYVMGILKSWFDNNIRTVNDLRLYEDLKSKRKSVHSSIFKYLGFNRIPSKSEEDMMNKWIDEFGFGTDLVLKACAKSVNTSNPNLKYFDSIITNWYNKGIRTVEDAEREEIEFNNKNSKKLRSKTLDEKSKKTTPFKTKNNFINFEQGITNDFSREELESIIKRNK